ncbi:hypothetical protein ACO0K2_17495 [Undibacterium sp. MH2W]|uniref:hypothetical protein n=1 Tax=Undibacterium sp. MH2W TaxID=3413044 RepID=UPI003BF0B27A
MNALTDVSPVLIPIFALLIPIVGIIASAVLKIVRLQLLHETVRQMSANGQPIPTELLNKIIDPKSN